jgi:hypothetical protein
MSSTFALEHGFYPFTSVRASPVVLSMEMMLGHESCPYYYTSFFCFSFSLFCSFFHGIKLFLSGSHHEETILGQAYREG